MDAAVIDSREPQWVQRIDLGVPITVAQLEFGDAWLSVGSDLVVVERKTPQDLLGSIGDERIFKQAAGCRALTPFAYLVITGAIYPGPDGRAMIGHQPTGWQYNAVAGALVTIQELGLYVVTVRDDADYGPALRRLASRDRHGVVTYNPAKAIKTMAPGEAMLAALPGIGVDRAKTLLAYYQTPAQALSALVDPDDDSVPGIGTVTKANVVRALGLLPGSRIYVNEIPF